jgi:putative addiction module antidote
MSMRHTLKVVDFGDSLGFVLPEEVLAVLRVGEGDAVSFVEMSDGLHLTSRQVLIDRQVDLGIDFMEEYHDVLRALAQGPDESKGE